MKFDIVILNESGYEEACLGISLSYNSTIERSREVAIKLANKDGGHNKFLESIYVWLYITAARYWWQQFDTYRLATKQSGSTMHTIMKRDLTTDDFEVNPVTNEEIDKDTLDKLNLFRNNNNFEALKQYLPESYLQDRVVCINYKSLRNIMLQRHDHKLAEWKIFCNTILGIVQHPELLPNTWK